MNTRTICFVAIFVALVLLRFFTDAPLALWLATTPFAVAGALIMAADVRRAWRRKRNRHALAFVRVPSPTHRRRR